MGSAALFCSLADGAQVTPALINAVEWKESGSGRVLEADGGRSIGVCMMSRAAWKDVNHRRMARGAVVYNYDRFVRDSKINRIYSAEYLRLLNAQLRARLGRGPTVGELYAAYNMGLASFERCGLDLLRVNPATRASAAQVERYASQ